MLKNKSIDYIFGMITGISVSITFWACTNTDLIASNDTSGESNAVQEVKITNWSSMPDDFDCDITNTPTVKISSSGNDVDIAFPSSIDVHLKSVPSGGIDVDVDIDSWPILDLDVKVKDVPYGCCD